MTKILMLALLLINSASQAEIFKCVDKYGKVSYSDRSCQEAATSEVFKPKLGSFKQEPSKYQIIAHNAPTMLPSQFNTQRLHLLVTVYALMSVLCFVCYFIDKRAAEKGLWRIPEKSLHILELLGGWPGAFMAQRLLRHKNRKPSYQLVFWLIVGIHVVGLTQLR
jgi:uncharacterized membrane protein YsdA (DUF1294 family)